MANEQAKFEDDVPQFSGKTNEEVVEWVTDVKLWEAEHKETKPRLRPRLYRRGLLGLPKQIIKTLLGKGDPANFRRSENNGCEDTLGEQGQEALDNDFDVRQGKSEPNQDHINREEMSHCHFRTRRRSHATRGRCVGTWLILTSALSVQEMKPSIRIVTEGCTGLSAVKKAITRQSCCDGESKFAVTVVNRKTGP